MKVTLAVPTDGSKADETIEVDDARGSQLIHTGRARAVEVPVSRQTRAERDAAGVRAAVRAKAAQSAASILPPVVDAPEAPADQATHDDDKAGK